MLLKDKAWYATVIIISSEKIKEKGKKNKQQHAIILCKKFIYKHWKCTRESYGLCINFGKSKFCISRN